jgi:hypothetical protein
VKKVVSVVLLWEFHHPCLLLLLLMLPVLTSPEEWRRHPRVHRRHRPRHHHPIVRSCSFCEAVLPQEN